MKLFKKEKSKEQKEFRKFASKHCDAFVEWETLHRANFDNFYEMHLEEFLDAIGRDSLWYYTFLNNIRLRNINK
jgi:hypothetical protein